VIPIIVEDRIYGAVTAGVRRGRSLRRSGDVVDRLVGVAHQAATAFQNADLLDHVRHQAMHDPLTDTPNQRLFADRTNAALSIARRAGETVALLYLDLDQFKVVNDTQGHAVGDRLLQEVAARLRSALRDSDTLARIGGDEFVALLPRLPDASGAERAAEKLSAQMSEPFVIAGDEFVMSASIGIAVYPEDGEDFESLLHGADAAMYRAKKAGPGTWTRYAT
jgi:diguanylate cyclase (GGDEF)-like protein